MRLAVEQELGFTVSAGIASNKVLAKLASSMNKPNKQVRKTLFFFVSACGQLYALYGYNSADADGTIGMVCLCRHSLAHATEPNQIVDLSAARDCSFGLLREP